VSQAAIEQDVLEGEVEHPQVCQRYFKTLDGLADYIKVFKVVRGQWGHGTVPDVGECYILEYHPEGRM